MPNILATLALATYPLFTLLLFILARPQTAVALTLLIGEMALPAGYGFDFPLIPPLDKQTIPILSAFVFAVLFGRKHLKRPLRGAERFVLLLAVSAYMTVRTNGDPIRYGETVLPGETAHDAISELIRTLFSTWAPFYLGRCFFKSSRDLASLARVMAIAAAIYAFPILIEIRLSPQLSRWIYGYAASGFSMVYRWGGYRPVVFFINGLFLSVFMLFCTMMAVALTRARKGVFGLPMVPLCLFLCFIVLICKSSGTIVYALLFLPLLAFASPVTIMNVAVVLSVFVLAYPLLRIWDVIPTAKIGDLVRSISGDRAESLMYRFNMEQGLLDRLRERFAFGWGGYGRNFVYTPWGQELTVVDGLSIIQLSTRGLIGYAALFGLYLTPVIQARRFIKKIQQRDSRYLICGLTLVIAVLMLDMTMNAPNNPFLTMLVGALSGSVPGILAEEKARSAALAEEAALMTASDRFSEDHPMFEPQT
jgi:hypothetical protein